MIVHCKTSSGHDDLLALIFFIFHKRIQNLENSIGNAIMQLPSLLIFLVQLFLIFFSWFNQINLHYIIWFQQICMSSNYFLSSIFFLSLSPLGFFYLTGWSTQDTGRRHACSVLGAHKHAARGCVSITSWITRDGNIKFKTGFAFSNLCQSCCATA